MVAEMKIPNGYKQTEVGIIPSDWEVKPLGTVLKIMYGKSQKGVADVNGDYPILGSGGIIGKSKTFLYNKPSVLIGRKGTIDKPQFMSTPFWTVDTLFYTEVFDNFSPKFLYYKFLTLSWYSFNEASGVPSLNAKTIEKILIPVPPTKAEQTAIATALNDADELISSLEKLIAKKRNIKQGAMQELLRPKEGWEVRKLGEIVQVIKGQLITEKTAVPDNIPVIGGGMTVSYFHNKPNRRGVTITISASGAYAGYISIHNYPIFASDCSTISESKDYDIYFLYFSLLNRQRVIFGLQTGGGQPHVYPQQLKDLIIPIPKNKSKQQHIAQILSDMDAEIELLENKLEKYKKIKQGMMQNLLTGKIRLV